MSWGITSRQRYEVIEVALVQRENGRCFTEIWLDSTLPLAAGSKMQKGTVHSVSKQINCNGKRILNDWVLRLAWSPPAVSCDDPSFEMQFYYGFREFERHVSIFTVGIWENCKMAVVNISNRKFLMRSYQSMLMRFVSKWFQQPAAFQIFALLLFIMRSLSDGRGTCFPMLY